MAGPFIRKNDMVFVRTGKDKGKTGKVLTVDAASRRAIVEGVAMVKHFIRPDRSKNVQGGVMEKESKVPLSRLMLYCPECAQGVRARAMKLEDGTRARACAKCGTVFETGK
ncbi:MAG: 50S ribosomal protein L24 [Candidatus Aminicenantes bacterium]|nr:50S ribosomal protein L24 [Candidatus Aminicenantes bacterium]